MSEELIRLVYTNFRQGSRLAVLMAIAEVCNLHEPDTVTSQLAGISRLSPSTVFVSIKALRRERWIFTDRITGQGGTLIFQLNVPKLGRGFRSGRNKTVPTHEHNATFDQPPGVSNHAYLQFRYLRRLEVLPWSAAFSYQKDGLMMILLNSDAVLRTCGLAAVGRKDVLLGRLLPPEKGEFIVLLYPLSISIHPCKLTLSISISL